MIGFFAASVQTRPMAHGRAAGRRLHRGSVRPLPGITSGRGLKDVATASESRSTGWLAGRGVGLGRFLFGARSYGSGFLTPGGVGASCRSFLLLPRFWGCPICPLLSFIHPFPLSLFPPLPISLPLLLPFSFLLIYFDYFYRRPVYSYQIGLRTMSPPHGQGGLWSCVYLAPPVTCAEDQSVSL